MRSLWKRFLRPKLFLIIGIAIAVAASYWTLSSEFYVTSVTGEGSIDIAISGLGPGNVKFFSYQDHVGDKVRFLLARDSSSRIHAAVDACERCYGYHRGYTSSDGRLICRFCGNHYKLEAMETGLASCVPIKLSFQLAGQAVRIKTAELERRRHLF
jgi:uncharacterized membrane protein